MSKKRNKTYNPNKFLQIHSHYNEDYIVFAIDSMALGVLNKQGKTVAIGATAYKILQESICDRNTCFGVLYKEGDKTFFQSEEAVINRCTGSDAVAYINQHTLDICDEIGMADVLGRFYFITGDMEWEWTDVFIYEALKQGGAFDLLVTQREYMKLELEDMEKHLNNYDPKKSQVGGTHYSNLAVQPAEIIKGLRLSWNLANAYKYVSRFEFKNQQEDLAKAYDYIQRELHDGYKNYQRAKAKIPEEKTCQYLSQFTNHKQQLILKKIEGLSRKIWVYNNAKYEEQWGGSLMEILYYVNQLCKEKYNVAAY